MWLNVVLCREEMSERAEVFREEKILTFVQESE